jgi:hypothetical protein
VTGFFGGWGTFEIITAIVTEFNFWMAGWTVKRLSCMWKALGQSFTMLGEEKI